MKAGIIKDHITVVIPTLPSRRDLLGRAVMSVQNQSHPNHLIHISSADDTERQGAWVTRNRAANQAQTEWMAFLDDDDEFLPHHLSVLLAAAEQHRADVVWGWYEVIGGTDPFPHYRGRQYDPAQPHVVPITYLIRTELFRQTRGFQPDHSAGGSWDLQDQGIFDDASAAGGKLLALEETTWLWHHHAYNTSGLPTRPGGPNERNM